MPASVERSERLRRKRVSQSKGARPHFDALRELSGVRGVMSGVVACRSAVRFIVSEFRPSNTHRRNGSAYHDFQYFTLGPRFVDSPGYCVRLRRRRRRSADHGNLQRRELHMQRERQPMQLHFRRRLQRQLRRGCVLARLRDRFARKRPPASADVRPSAKEMNEEHRGY